MTRWEMNLPWAVIESYDPLGKFFVEGRKFGKTRQYIVEGRLVYFDSERDAQRVADDLNLSIC